MAVIGGWGCDDGVRGGCGKNERSCDDSPLTLGEKSGPSLPSGKLPARRADNSGLCIDRSTYRRMSRGLEASTRHTVCNVSSIFFKLLAIASLFLPRFDFFPRRLSSNTQFRFPARQRCKEGLAMSKGSKRAAYLAGDSVPDIGLDTLHLEPTADGACSG